MHRLLIPPLSALLALCVAAPAAGQTAAPKPVQAAAATAWGDARLPQAQERLLASRHTGKTYRIQTMAVGKAPPGGYPVLYLLDGDAFFPVAAMMAQGLEMRAEENRATPLLIVAVGYPGGQLYDLAARAHDYTPPAASYAHTGDRLSTRFGGAEAFRRFLQEELKPVIASRFAVQPQQQTLFGHSYGALFGLYTLLHHTADFRHYLLASPSVWWNRQQVLSGLAAFLPRQQKTPTPVSVRLTVGEYEQTLAPYLPAMHERQAILNQRGMVSQTRRIGAQLAALPAAAMRVETVVYPATTHAGAAFAALADGLEYVYARCREDSACPPAVAKRHPAISSSVNKEQP